MDTAAADISFDCCQCLLLLHYIANQHIVSLRLRCCSGHVPDGHLHQHCVAVVLLLCPLHLCPWVLRFSVQQDCKASNAAIGQASIYPLNFPLGIATDGQYLWISDKNARVRVCTWFGNTLTDCRYTTTSSNGLTGAGALAVDRGRNLLYHILDEQACVMVCRNPSTLDTRCPCYTFDPISSTVYYPTGLAIGFDQVWVTSGMGVSRCPQTSSGFDFNKCITKQIADPADPTGKTPFNTAGILVDTSGAGAAYIADNSGAPPAVLKCDKDLTSCTKHLGDGTFTYGTPPLTSGPGYVGMALSQGLLYVPLQLPGGPTAAISICNNPADVSGCQLSPWATTPARKSKDTVNLAVIPDPGPDTAAAGASYVMRSDAFVSEGEYSFAPTVYEYRNAGVRDAALNTTAAIEQPQGGATDSRGSTALPPGMVEESGASDSLAAAAASGSASTSQAVVGAALAGDSSSSNLAVVQPASAAAWSGTTQPVVAAEQAYAGTATSAAAAQPAAAVAGEVAWSGAATEQPAAAAAGPPVSSSSSSPADVMQVSVVNIRLDVWNVRDITQSAYLSNSPYPSMDSMSSSSSSSSSPYTVRAAVLSRRKRARSRRSGAVQPSVVPSVPVGEVGAEVAQARIATASGGGVPSKH